jgi:glutathione S-transferase
MTHHMEFIEQDGCLQCAFPGNVVEGFPHVPHRKMEAFGFLITQPVIELPHAVFRAIGAAKPEEAPTDQVTDQLGQREWCEGASITLADLALVSALIYLDLRQPERDWRGPPPNLAAWFARISERTGVRIALAG